MCFARGTLVLRRLISFCQPALPWGPQKERNPPRGEAVCVELAKGRGSDASDFVLSFI